jgi:hypothetical protein
MRKVAVAERRGVLCELDFWEGRLLAETGDLRAATLPLRRVSAPTHPPPPIAPARCNLNTQWCLCSSGAYGQLEAEPRELI